MLSQCDTPRVLLVTQVANVFVARVEMHRGDVISHCMVAIVDLWTVGTFVVDFLTSAS